MHFLDRDGFLEAIPALQTLFVRAFGREIVREYLTWRYADNPAGDVLFCVETDGERIIANYSASPCVLERDGVEARSALSLMTMTDPDFAGKGLFPRLAGALYDQMAERGYGIIWGYPNANSHPPFIRKLQWKDIYEVPTMLRELAGIDRGAVDLQRDDAFALDYTSVAQPAGLIHVRKSPDYLRWRYTRNPLHRYANLVLQSGGVVSSYCVTKRYGDSLDVVDFQALDEKEGLELMRQVLVWAVGEGLTAANVWAPRHHFIHPLCERLQFGNRERITYFGGRLLGASAALDGAYHYDDWFIQMGDSDVY